MNPSLPAIVKIDKLDIDLGRISEPATLLIQKISDATGGVFAPYQLKRMAKAKAEADEISALSEIRITTLRKRALERFVREETKKQQNIEKITGDAIPMLSPGAEPNKMDDDWVTNFFDKSRLVSDKEMQALWSKILAGEANDPGIYSKRVVNLLGSLDKKEAELFAKLCGFSWVVGNEIKPLVFDPQQPMYNDQGINFSSLKQLDAIGMISFESVAGYITKFKSTKKILVSYNTKPLIIEFKNDGDNELEVGTVLLTNEGKQLSRICEPEHIVGFYEYVMKYWSDKELTLSSPYNHPPLK